MRRAVEAGVDTIEHGYGGTEEIFQQMAAKGIAYLPTLTAVEAIAEYSHQYQPGQTSPEMEQALRAFKIALENNVLIGVQRRRSFCAWHELPGAGMDGSRRDESGSRNPRRHRHKCRHQYICKTRSAQYVLACWPT